MTPDQRASLILAARTASERAYCPYSKFRVGAALMMESGEIVAGCNVENASYGLTICAERVALFRMIAEGRDRPIALAIFTPTGTPTAPCGACRQVLNEFADTGLPVTCSCLSDEVIETTLGHLLPQAFGPRNLGG